MNNIKLALLGFGILFGSMVTAQETNQISSHRLTKEQRIEKHMARFGEDLDLTAEQKAKITEIRKNSIAERQQLKNKASLEKSDIGAAMKSIHLKEQEQISKVLTPEQARKYNSLKEERKDYYRGRDRQIENNQKQKGHRNNRKEYKRHHKRAKSQKKMAPMNNLE